MSVETLFETEHYQYPLLHADIRTKITALKQSIKKLEANLISPLDQPQLLDKRLTIDYAAELNPSQLLAATTIDGKALVIAGAGSGKTKTLTYRTSYLIENGVAAHSILLLTFTRKSANEIKGRVQSLLRDTEVAEHLQVSQIMSGTFHSFCHGLLRRYSGLLGINPRFTILDSADSEDAIDLIHKDKNYPVNNNKQAFPRKSTLQKIISASRNRRLLIKDLIEQSYPDIALHIPIIEQLAQDFHTYKRANHLYDFDDIIGQVVHHLKANAKFRKIVQETYRYVMVDEYQDTNIPQKQLIDILCQPNTVSLMVVGDDNQSIYAFRGANYKNILMFGDTYPDAKLIKLEQNYRSTPAILDYINALSAQITLGYQKQLFSNLSIKGAKPTLSRRSNESTEARFIAEQIIALKPDLNYNDFAVLCRTSFQSNHIQLEFMERNIPFVMVGGIKFIEKRHIKDVLALVKVLYNPNDTIAWHRILTLFKGIGSVTATKLTRAFDQHNNTIEPLLDPQYAKKNEQLTELYHTLKQCEQAANLTDVIEILLAFYLPILRTIEDNWRERAEDFRVLKNLANEHTGLDSFLESLALDPPNDSVAALTSQGKENTDAVTISTIHSAKGLEWPIVFVNALVDGFMPHHRSLSDFEALEEERKLFYVACSRAKLKLYLTAPDHLSSYSGYFDKVSRFVAEVPENRVDIDLPPEISNQQSQNEPAWW